MITIFLPGRRRRWFRRRPRARGPATWSVLAAAAFSLYLVSTQRPDHQPSLPPAPATAARSAILASLGLPLPPPAPAPTLAPAETPRVRRGGRISPFDELIHAASAREGLDWRLVAALIYEESQFDPRAVSRTGARGLMQVMPAFSDLPPDSLFDPELNLGAGLRIFANPFQGFAHLDSLDRIRFSLAVYNAGLGRLLDARRIAGSMGLDPDRWDGGVAEALPLLDDPMWSAHVKYGTFPGETTVRFVDQTVARYERYAARFSPQGPTVPYRRDELAAAADSLTTPR